MLNRIVAASDIDGQKFDTVIIGSGFGSGFFLAEAIKHKGAGRILVLEWGPVRDHETQITENRNSAVPPGDTFVNHGERPWNFTIAFGGGTNCWFAQTPRLHPSDFKIRSLYGVGQDWPLDYEELEPFYCEAEEIMQVSGDNAMGQVLPRSQPFPQPPHRMSTPDSLLAAARSELHFVMPTARARISTPTRNACCANLRCALCPVDAKFTGNNGLQDVFGHPSVSLCMEAKVLRLDSDATHIRRAVFESGGKQYSVSGELFVLGANAIHSPAVLQRSGLGGGLVGKGLHEAYGQEVEVFLDGVENFDGSTITTGLDYGCYDGEFRRTAGSTLLYFENRWRFGFREEKERWRQTLPITVVVENPPVDDNRVETSSAGVVEVFNQPAGDYPRRGAQRAIERLEKILAPLPVEAIHIRGERPTESHLQGTLRMGNDADSSVVDGGQIHHRFRNLAVVGSSLFPSCSAANPSLTVAALSLRAARRIFA